MVFRRDVAEQDPDAGAEQSQTDAHHRGSQPEGQSKHDSSKVSWMMFRSGLAIGPTRTPSTVVLLEFDCNTIRGCNLLCRTTDAGELPALWYRYRT